jgi:hypothetical protein
MPTPSISAILPGLALACQGGVGLQLQQPALWPQAACLLALASGALGL